MTMKRVLDGIGLGIVAFGGLCCGLAIGFQLQPAVASHAHEAALRDGGLTRSVLSNDGAFRRGIMASEGKRVIMPDVVIPPVSNGLAPVIGRIETTQPVVFLTIDDGNYKGKSVVATMKRYHLRASLFLADLFIWHDPQFFSQLMKLGSVIENHTDRHDLKMVQQSYEYQRREICTMTDAVMRYYGKSPTLFRPPGGRYNQDTQRAAAACGMRAVVMWSARVENGVVEYQDGRTALRPGDIVLAHFRPEFEKDIAAFVTAKNDAKLRVDIIENWIR